MSLRGKRVLITRSREDSREFISAIEADGGEAVVVPMISISDPDSWSGCDDALERLESFDGLVFASGNGVRKFFERAEKKGIRLHVLEQKAIYAVGEKTKRLIEEYALPVRFVPDDYSLTSLATNFTASTVFGKRFLLVRGNIGKEELALRLTKLGAIVESIVVYKTSKPSEKDGAALRQMIESGEIDIVTFASPSAVRNFLEDVPAETCNQSKIAVIGPTTRDAAVNASVHVDIIADVSTVEGLARAMSKFYEKEDVKDMTQL